MPATKLQGPFAKRRYAPHLFFGASGYAGGIPLRNETSTNQTLDEQRLRSMSTVDVIRCALDEAKLLAQAEVLHAKQELKEELKAAQWAGIALGAAGALALCAVCMGLVALAGVLPLAFPLAALVVGLALLAISALLAFFGIRRLPRKPLPKTLARLRRDIEMAREQMA